MISVRGLHARLLRGIDLEVRRGEILAVVGPNGAGKTTLLEAMCGLLPRKGEVVHRGASLRSLADHARVFSYMPDETVPADELEPRDLAPEDLLAKLGVKDTRTRMSLLSRGERKRVEIAQAMAPARPVLVLDEPFAVFDPIQLDVITDVVRAYANEHSVVCSIHQLESASRLADRILLLAEGRALACGTLEELRAESGEESLEEILRALVKRHAA